MRLGSVIDIVGGELINSSSISHFNEVKFDSKSIKNGDLFIAMDKNFIDEAINNGAYGILFDEDIECKKNLDIAFIKVDSIFNASLKLLRLILLSKSYKFYLINSLMFELSQYIITSKKIIFLSESNLINFHKIVTSEDDTIFFSTDENFLNIIWPRYHKIDKKSEKLQVIKEYLFESTISFEDEFIYKAKIAPIFLNDLSKLLNFCTKNSIDFSLKSLNFIKHFEPIFIDKNLFIKDFFKSNRVLIIEPDINLFIKEVSFLIENTKWAKTILFLPSQKNGIKIENIKFFKNTQELIKILKTEDFNFSLIGGLSSNEIKPLLNKKIEEYTLF